MNQGKYVFAQIAEFLPRRVFDRLVLKYNGNKFVRVLSCWNQMLSLIFGQLTNRDSLRELVLVIDAHRSKTYHLGLGSGIKLATLARANINRSCKIYEEFAWYMIDQARRINVSDDFAVKVDGNIYAFDSTTIDLCLNVFWWAEFRKNKGGIKVHTLYNVKTQIPSFIHITTASVNDIQAMDQIPYEKGSYYIFDRGYNDFDRLFQINLLQAWFIVRAKDNYLDYHFWTKTDTVFYSNLDSSLLYFDSGFEENQYIESSNELCDSLTAALLNLDWVLKTTVSSTNMEKALERPTPIFTADKDKLFYG